MTSEYSVVPYSIEHRAAALKLERQVLARSPSALDRYFSWKYEQNPYLPAPLMALVFAGSDLVAMRGLCGSRWLLPGGNATTIPAAEDLVVDRNHRNRGLFLLIDRELRRVGAELGYRRLVSVSAGQTTRQLQPITGWTQVAVYNRAMRPVRSQRAFRTNPYVRKITGKARRVLRQSPLDAPASLSAIRIDRLVDDIAMVSPNVEVSRTPEIDALVRLSAAPTEAVRHDRSRQFYAWRLRNPDRHYRYLYWRDSSIRGFIALAVMPTDPPQLRVVASGAETTDLKAELLSALTRASRAALVLLPELQDRQVRSVLDKLGFETDDQARSPMVMVFVRGTERGMATTQPEPWHVDLLDTMLV